MRRPTLPGIFLYRKHLASTAEANLRHVHPAVHPEVYLSASGPAETGDGRQTFIFSEERRLLAGVRASAGSAAVPSRGPSVTLPHAEAGQSWISGRGEAEGEGKFCFSTALYFSISEAESGAALRHFPKCICFYVFCLSLFIFHSVPPEILCF